MIDAYYYNDGDRYLLRNTHVTSALNEESDEFPLKLGEWAIVVIDGDSVESVEVVEGYEDAVIAFNE